MVYLNKKISIRAGISIIIFLLVVSVISFYFLKLDPQVNHQMTNQFQVTIKGTVSFADGESIPEEIPYKVTLYPSSYSLDYLCYSNDIEIANISWDDGKEFGEFILTVSLPVSQEVVISTDCYGCHHKRIYVSPKENFHEVELQYGGHRCHEAAETYTNTDDALKRAREILDNVDAERTARINNINDSEDIKADITRGWEKIRDASSYSNINESLFEAHYALFYVWKSFFKVETNSLKMCVNEVGQMLNSHNDSCFIPPSEGWKLYSSSKKVLQDKLEDIERLNSKNYYFEENPSLLQTISNTYQDRKEAYKATNDCDKAMRLISESFAFQEPYCKKRDFTLSLLDWILATIAIIVGIFIGKFGGRW